MNLIDLADPDGTIERLALVCSRCDAALDLADPTVVMADRLTCGDCAAADATDDLLLAA